MFFSQLSTLDQTFAKHLVFAIDQYFASLSPTAQQLITISKLAAAVNVDFQIAANILKNCEEIGFLKKQFGVKCPTCGMLLLQVDSIQHIQERLPYCSQCEKMIAIEEINYNSDIIVLFSIQSEASPFTQGQQSNSLAKNALGECVVPMDSLESGVLSKIVTYKDLFSPDELQYSLLENMLSEMGKIHPTTTEHGASLENLVCKLFSYCSVFRTTTKHKSQTNQIDATVRINSLLDSILFARMGSCFYIECKNEKNTPTIDYLQKFRSILHDADMKFGIFISKMKEPTTYKENTNHIFLRDQIVIVRFDLEELTAIICEQKNLLECLDKKITEITTNAARSMGQDGLGLFDA